jgi:hypothetical protein
MIPRLRHHGFGKTNAAINIPITAWTAFLLLFKIIQSHFDLTTNLAIFTTHFECLTFYQLPHRFGRLSKSENSSP